MRLENRNLEKNGPGTVRLYAQEPEDMWHAFNLIDKGDRLTAATVRKVMHETGAGAASAKSVRLNMTIKVQDIAFDADACQLRVSGKVDEENPHVRKGAFHTIQLGSDGKAKDVKRFTIEKAEWDVLHLERLKSATSLSSKADVAAVVMSPTEATVCLLTEHMTVVRARHEVTLPRKRQGSSGRQKAITGYYGDVFTSLVRHVDPEVIKTIIVAGPGFLKDGFVEFAVAEAPRRELPLVFGARDRYMLASASAGSKQALQEVLADPAVASRLASTKAAGEVRALQAFFEMMRDQPDRAAYGYKHVYYCVEQGAVDELLLSDTLFRSTDVDTRRAYAKLVADTEEARGKVHIFSGMHSSGEQLAQISGIAATLRFEIPDLDLVVEAEEERMRARGQQFGGAAPQRASGGGGAATGGAAHAVLDMRAAGAAGEERELGEDEVSITSGESSDEEAWWQDEQA